jgi:hypothetical protein
MRESTGLDNNNYDAWLSANKKGRELQQRSAERKAALKKDCSGWAFNIDKTPVKVKDIHEFRKELDKRGLAIYGEYKGKKK